MISEAEFEEFFRATAGRVQQYLQRRLPQDAVEDVLAEVFLVAWRRRADLPAGEAARLAWVFATAHRLTLQFFRTRPGEVLTAALDERAQWGQRETTAGVDQAEVRQALDTLSPRDRELLTLTVWEGLSPSQAAQVVGMSVGAVRVRLHRARKRLARELEETPVQAPVSELVRSV